MRRSIRFVTSAGVALLLAANAAATASAATGWHRDGPDGTQYASGFALDMAFATSDAWYSDFVAEPDGDSFLAVRTSGPIGDADAWANDVVRFEPRRDGSLKESTVVAFERFRDAALWDAGVEIEGVRLAPGPRNGAASPLAVSPSGDALVTVAAIDDGSVSAYTLVRVAPDGSLQKVLTSGELAASGVFPAGVAAPWLTVAASTDDLLWGRAEGWDPATDDLVRLVQVVDPTADGDWSDREVRPLVLPETVGLVRDLAWDWGYGGFLPAPAGGSDVDGRTVLLPVVGREGEYRLSRLTDSGSDGRLLDEGETELVFAGQAGSSLDVMMPPSISVVPGSEPVELAAAGLTQPTRVSLASEGAVADVVRGLFAPGPIIALADGSIYVGVHGEPGPKGARYSILRLVRDEGGAGAAPVDSTEPTPTLAPPGEASIARDRVTPDIPILAVWVGGQDPDGKWYDALLRYGADGSGPADLFPEVQARSGACVSADGRRATVFAEIDVPNEVPLVLLDLAGREPPRLLREGGGSVVCPFPAEAVAVLHSDLTTLDRIDLADGATSSLLDGLVPGLCPAPSPDGRTIAVATGEGGTSLSLVDVVAGASHTLLDGLPGAVVRQAWSPDGTRLAVAVGVHDPLDPRASGPVEILLVDPTGGSGPRSLMTFEGPAPDLDWSQDGHALSVRETDAGDECGCGSSGRLTIVDTESGVERVVTPNASFAAWSPTDPDVLAWGTPVSLVVEHDGVPMAIEALPDPDEPGKSLHWTWFQGWSPDGRYLAFEYPRVMTVDTRTGETRVLLTETEALSPYSAQWLP